MVLLILHLIMGYRKLRDLDYYQDDPLVKRLLGLQRLPNVATVSRALRTVDQKAIDKVRSLDPGSGGPTVTAIVPGPVDAGF